MKSISSLLDDLDSVLPHLSLATKRGFLGTLKAVRPSYDSRHIWKSALLLAEMANICTGGHKATRAAVAITATGTALSVMSGKIETRKSSLHLEWNSIAAEAGIPTPERISSVPVGPIPPRVIAAVINLSKKDNEVRFHDEYELDSDVHMQYTTVFSCTRHGLTYAVDLVAGATRPYIVLEYSGDHYIFPLKTITVNGNILLDTCQYMLVAEGTDCTEMCRHITHAVISTFDTRKYALYPSEDIATLNDTYPRQDISMAGFDAEDMLGDMRAAMLNGLSRAYMFHGRPGTGKTTLVKQLAWRLNEYPLVILPAARILTAKYPLDSMANYLSQLLEVHKHAIFAIDDLDGCEIVDKNLATTQLIEFMDRLRDCAEANSASYIILCTANDPGNISDTIVGRSGRIDELVEIKPPDWRRIMSSFKVPRKTAKAMASRGFTMADVKNVLDLETIGYPTADAIRHVSDMLRSAR